MRASEAPGARAWGWAAFARSASASSAEASAEAKGPTLSMNDGKIFLVLRTLRWWADLLDSRFRVPGTGIRFGIDPLLSLMPGIGDLASPVFALVLITHALQLGVPRVVIARMAVNALVDAMIGAVPLAGNVGDVFWRANATNLALLERHARPGMAPTRGDYAFVYTVAALFGLLLLIPVLVGLWLGVIVIGLIWRWLAT